MKIVVYAISKNESKFVERWCDSMKEADGIVVMDTGSKDDTVAKLKAHDVRVQTKIVTPWRFDTARNHSIDFALAEFPDADVLVCTDLDEILLPGWRAKLEEAWLKYKAKHGKFPTTAQYEYVWNFLADGRDGAKFIYRKVHDARCGARWAHPVHEILDYGEQEKTCVHVEGMRLEHHADPLKSRGQYLDLLRISVEECPEDDRNTHYYGRELMFRGKWNEAIKVLTHHLEMPKATWNAERAASMRYIARCYCGLKQIDKAYEWFWKAIKEAPEQREAAVELQWIAYNLKAPDGRQHPDWKTVVNAGIAAVKVTVRDMNYTTKPEAWNERPWDLLALGFWYLGMKDDARKAVKIAIQHNPNDARILDNARLMGVAEDELTELVKTK